METDASVPLPLGTGPILNVPPSSAARSLMPSNPMERVLEISSGEIPRPLSFTSKIIRPRGFFQMDHHVGGARVANDVGQGFLKNAEERGRQIRRQDRLVQDPCARRT